MKKKVLLMAALATMMATTVNAQTLINFNGGLIIPREITANNSPQISTQAGNQISIYGTDLTLIHTFTVDDNYYDAASFVTSEGHQYISGLGGDGGCSISQTFFNNDELYEYISCSGSNASVKNETGAVLFSITADEGLVFYWINTLILDNDNYYLIALMVDDDWDHRNIAWYRIDRQSQSITRVEGNMPINVFPSVVDRDQSITIELGEDNNASEVQVVNAVGQMVKRISVQPGQREVQLRASDLNRGMHILSTRSHEGQGACKIIVK